MKRPLQLVIILALCQPGLAQEPRVAIPGLGISLQPNASVPEGFAEEIMEILLPSAALKAEGLSSASEPARAYQVTYTRGGGIITVDRPVTRVLTKEQCRLSLNIQRPASARIRHQIMIGTDLAEWEILRRDPPSSDGEPFARTYLLRRPIAGELRGIAFYEGTWAELGCAPEVDEDSLLRLTWGLAERLRHTYERHIAPIAKTSRRWLGRADPPGPSRCRQARQTNRPAREAMIGNCWTRGRREGDQRSWQAPAVAPLTSPNSTA